MFQVKDKKLSPGVRFAAAILLFLCLAAGFFWSRQFAGKNAMGDSGYWKKSIQENLLGKSPSPVEMIPEEKRTIPDLILLGARQEVINGTRYDASYEVMSYPGGDVSSDRGACTDVVIRAFRHAGIDLQQLIHEDMRENFHFYPQKWGLNVPDTNIDHRRVPNQICFLERSGTALSHDASEEPDEWQWGDVVYWRFSNGRDHCGIISDRTGKGGLPLVIHNAGSAREEDCLQRWEIVGHFRFP